MASLSIGDSSLSYFGLAAHEPHHIAFRVTGPVLAGASARQIVLYVSLHSSV